MKLYELTGQFLELLEMAESGEYDEEAINDTLEGLEGEFEDKADGYAKVIRQLTADTENIDAEIKRLTGRKQACQNAADRIKKNLEENMRLTGKTKFKTLLFGFGIQKNPASVEVLDESKIPKKFWIEQDPKLDKRGLLAYVKTNPDVTAEYARLKQTESLRIR